MAEFQLILFIYMLAGFIAKKAKMISEKTQIEISDLLVQVLLPCMIFSAFVTSGTDRNWTEVGHAILYAAIGEIICCIFAFTLYRKMRLERQCVLRYCLITTNYSFLGIPTCQAAFGDEAYLLASVSQIIYRIGTWGIGAPLVSRSSDKSKKVPIRKFIFSPCMIALFLGLVYLVDPFPIPSFLAKAIKNLGACSTPLCMVFVGFVMAEVKWSKKDLGILAVYSALRLIVLPAIVFGIVYVFDAEPTVACVTVLQTAMPAPSTSAVFAGKYGKDVGFAGQMVFVTTVLSLVTTPVLVGILKAVFLS